MNPARIALVTGASKGIGLEVVRQLAARGVRVFLAARNRQAGCDAVADLRTAGGRVDFLELDVTDKQMIGHAAVTLAQAVDHLDVLVNNAGILEKDDKSVLTVSAGTVLWTFTTNTLGPLLVTHALLPLLLKSPAPRIINVSSGGGSLTEMEHWAPAYSISKTALNAVTRQFASALSEKGVAVNSVCPGWVRTAMGGSSAPRSVEEGADTIVWLAAEAPQDLTGKFLRDRKVIAW